MNYEADIRIDEEDLDLEWLEQPTKFMKYAKNAAQARLELDREKERLDVVKAEIDKDVRTNPEKYGIEKVTEAVVSNAILQSKKYHTANETYLEQKYETEIAQAAVSAMNQRKDALENLVKLHGQSYFAGPKMPRDLTRERAAKEEKDKKANTVINSGMQRRRTIN